VLRFPINPPALIGEWCIAAQQIEIALIKLFDPLEYPFDLKQVSQWDAARVRATDGAGRQSVAMIFLPSSGHVLCFRIVEAPKLSD
jgi:hypothetical protein